MTGTCYKFQSDKRTWTDARKHCVSLGGTLAVLETSLEESYVGISSFVALGFRDADTNVWIGLWDQSGRGIFRWVSGGC